MMFPQAVLFFGRVDASGCVDSRTEFLISPLQLVDPAAAADVPFSGVFRQECGVEVRATLQSLKDVEKFAMAVHDTMVNFPHDLVSPHCLGVAQRVFRWVELGSHGSPRIGLPPCTWLDFVQELNRPAILSMGDRAAWTPYRVWLLFRDYLPDITGFDPQAAKWSVAHLMEMLHIISRALRHTPQ